MLHINRIYTLDFKFLISIIIFGKHIDVIARVYKTVAISATTVMHFVKVKYAEKCFPINTLNIEVQTETIEFFKFNLKIYEYTYDYMNKNIHSY
jgi:hypothetical protein